MTAPEWAADIAVDAKLAKALVGSQFPSLEASDVRPFGAGWDNAAFLVDEHLVFRFPRRRVFANLISRELAILPHLAPHLPLKISNPLYAGKPAEEYPYDFAGYELIDGATLCSANVSDDRRAEFALPLARFLRALHDIDPAPFAARGLPRDELGRLDHNKRLPITRERLTSLTATGSVACADALIAWLESNPPAAPDERELRIVHGDLYARHVVLDRSGAPAGVIDWGDVHLGDPAIDIALAHLILPPHAHAAFREAYGGIDERTWNAARCRAIYHAVLELDYGVRADDAGMRSIGAKAIDFVLEAIPCCATPRTPPSRATRS